MSAQYPAQPHTQVQQGASGLATASVVLGAVGFLVGICAVVGLVLGLVARGQAKRGQISPARTTAGITVSAIALALNVLGGIALVALLPDGGSMTGALPAPF
ncbi:hypothetical protein AB2L28_01860 [Kineococcus sp. TBRC 1896]|uniref:DUF4190 domain-containing protein n=1 Tax=Kineococcus mangrovi TaxID=1660183 RepID=A0ABV4HX40_9ACTN